MIFRGLRPRKIIQLRKYYLDEEHIFDTDVLCICSYNIALCAIAIDSGV